MSEEDERIFESRVINAGYVINYLISEIIQ